MNLHYFAGHSIMFPAAPMINHPITPQEFVPLTQPSSSVTSSSSEDDVIFQVSSFSAQMTSLHCIQWDCSLCFQTGILTLCTARRCDHRRATTYLKDEPCHRRPKRSVERVRNALICFKTNLKKRSSLLWIWTGSAKSAFRSEREVLTYLLLSLKRS
jgi:hypothetical protein